MASDKTTGAGRTALLSWLSLLLGSGLMLFVGWRWNAPVAAWLAPVFLIRFFRDRERWYAALPAVPLLAVAAYVQFSGAWDLEGWMLPVFSVLRSAAFLVALYADRALRRRLPAAAATFVYPAVYLAVDYLLALTPLGTTLSASVTQLGFPAIAQLASVTGIWGLGFLGGWAASTANTVWDHRAELARVRRIAAAAGLALAAVVTFGSVRVGLAPSGTATVRVGSVTVPHVRDYWSWIDLSTPREVVSAHSAELASMTDALYAGSERAVAAGAKVVFWSEGNAVLTEDGEAAFLERARAFAREHAVYFAPAVLTLRYGSTLSDNKIVMIGPDGKEAFSFVKAKSWYPTGSDGILKTVDTPYGTIGAAICFDMDYPLFINRLARMGADIVVVPAYDSAGIRPFHTEVGLLRAVENGFSVVRQVNEGTSLAVDSWGRVLARQDFFGTEDRVMLADVPTRGVGTVYGLLGDWFAWAGMALAVVLVVAGIARGGKESTEAA
jgi:apolipoprotein N-acyltransferase